MPYDITVTVIRRPDAPPLPECVWDWLFDMAAKHPELLPEEERV